MTGPGGPGDAAGPGDPTGAGDSTGPGEPTGPHDSPVDDAGDEARRLLAAVQDWARRTLPAPPSGHPGPECQWCPLCQFAAVLRGEHPELVERIAEAGAAVTNAVKALTDTAARPRPRGADRKRPRPRPDAHVQRITLIDPADRTVEEDE